MPQDYTIDKNFKGITDPSEISHRVEVAINQIMDLFNALASKMEGSLQSLQNSKLDAVIYKGFQIGDVFPPTTDQFPVNSFGFYFSTIDSHRYFVSNDANGNIKTFDMG